MTNGVKYMLFAFCMCLVTGALAEAKLEQMAFSTGVITIVLFIRASVDHLDNY